jgi:cytochrome P450
MKSVSTMATVHKNIPTPVDVDLWTDESLAEPYANYRTLRDAGPVVYLERYGIFALPRFDEVRDALRQWQIFSSANGVGVNEENNARNRGSLLTSDGPEHVALRKIVGRPLGSDAMKAIRETITLEAERVAERVTEARTFDGVRDLAWHLPLTVVRQLVGLPEEGRERMLAWGSAGFNSGGPPNERSRAGLALRLEMVEYLNTKAVPGKLTPGGWGAQLYEAAERGEIPLERCAREMTNYVGPSLDTTINATSSALWLFAQHPDQWEAIRKDPSLIPNALQEVLRVESPVQFFTRYVTADVPIDDVIVAAGSRVLVMFASANRDERHWTEPERFDIQRDAKEQLAFGHGAHVCLGMPLARLEIESLLVALAKRIKRFHLGTPERSLNNTLRGFARLPLTVEV